MKGIKQLWVDILAIGMTILLFWVPLYFVIVNALKNPKDAALMNMKWPETIHIWENIVEVVQARDYMLFRAFYNSTLITVLAIVILVVISAMAGFVLQRRTDKATPFINFFVFAGLIIPPAVVPTIWVLQELGIFKTLTGIVAVEVALGFPFCVILFRGFMVGIPKEIDEAAVMDGYNKWRLFFGIILPLLKPVTATVVITQSVFIFNDFTNPLYFFPGADNATIQLTLYNFTSQFVSQWNLLFTNILLITIPLLVLFLIFNKKIVAGMTAGSVKG
ncbi:MAG: carbohydrate ABC transporter permease [Candidatus Pristimantibacillus sp.]